MTVLAFLPVFLGNLRGMQLLIVVLVILLLFGGKKIPELMRGLGKGVRSFKEGVNNIERDIDNCAEDPKK